jgi:hypothetical protein
MSTLQIVFLALAGLLMLLWLTLAARGPSRIEAPNQVAVLRYGPVLRTLALVLALLPLMVTTYVIAVFLWRSSTMLAYAGGSLIGTCLLSAVLLIEVSRGQVLITEDGITRLSPWRSRETIHWTEIQRVDYSSINGVFVVIGAGHRMRISRHLLGVKAFVETVKRKLGPERYSGAAASMEAIR